MHVLYAGMASLILSLRYAGKCFVLDMYVQYYRCKYMLYDLTHFDVAFVFL